MIVTKRTTHCPICGEHYIRQEAFTSWPVSRFERYTCKNGHIWERTINLQPLKKEDNS